MKNYFRLFDRGILGCKMTEFSCVVLSVFSTKIGSQFLIKIYVYQVSGSVVYRSLWV